jgi:hypothetical protein
MGWIKLAGTLRGDFIMSKKTFFFVSALLAAIPAIAQMPDGSDISKAIPIYFGQVAAGIGDKVTQPHVVYAVNLAKGQQMTFAANSTTGVMQMEVLRPSAVTVESAKGADVAVSNISIGAGGGNSADYLVPNAGTYYVVLSFLSTGVGYQVTLKSQGTPINVPNPPTTGCLSGQVDYLTYSLQLIAAELPDTISIGGVQACATCPVKPPAYSQIVGKMESALKANLPVQACYDSGGNIFQITLQHP